jgi:hypothetical protein
VSIAKKLPEPAHTWRFRKREFDEHPPRDDLPAGYDFKVHVTNDE